MCGSEFTALTQLNCNTNSRYSIDVGTQAHSSKGSVKSVLHAWQ